jgi:hypothetical protein
MMCTESSETHRGDGEIVYTLLHHSTSIKDNTCSLHFYRNVRSNNLTKSEYGADCLNEDGQNILETDLL